MKEHLQVGKDKRKKKTMMKTKHLYKQKSQSVLKAKSFKKSLQ